MKKHRFLSVLLTLALILALIPAFPLTASAAAESFNIQTAAGDASGTNWAFIAAAGVLVVYDGADIEITGTVNGRSIAVFVDAEAKITLNDVSITGVSGDTPPLMLSPGAAVTLTLKGANTLTAGASYAGIHAPKDTTLTINGTGSLTATGGDGGAGIGGGSDGSAVSANGTITINGGTVTAIGGGDAAGIGNGRHNSANVNGGAININGGVVTATGGSGAAGIGGGATQGSFYNNPGPVSISGGTVTATGGERGAGIGGGQYIGGGNITISGGTVNATGGGAGAGIGGGGAWSGSGGDGGNITISGGVVTAESVSGAGIGGGGNSGSYNDGGKGGAIKISGGTVTAKSQSGAGIGDGTNPSSAGAAGTFDLTGGGAVVFASSDTGASVTDKSKETTWNGILFDGDDGKIYGAAVEPTDDFEIPSGKTLTVGDGQTLNIKDGVTVTNNGTLDNNGAIDNKGTISGSGTISGDGTVIYPPDPGQSQNQPDQPDKTPSGNGANGGGGSNNTGYIPPDMTPFHGVTDPKPEPTASKDSPSDWAKKAVDKALELKLVPARLQGDWTADLTRADFCALAVKLYEYLDGKPIEARGYFDDTTDVNVQKLAGLGIVTGGGNGKFDPNGAFTREMALTLMYNMMVQLGHAFEPAEPSFADASDISPWAKAAIGALQKAKIVEGDGRYFNPSQVFTREMGIVTMMNILEKLT